MQFIFGDVTLLFNPTMDEYSKQKVEVVGSHRRALDGGLWSQGVVKKWQFTVSGVCSTQLPDIAEKLGSHFTFVDHDGESYEVAMTDEVKAEGYPTEQVGRFTVFMQEI